MPDIPLIPLIPPMPDIPDMPPMPDIPDMPPMPDIPFMPPMPDMPYMLAPAVVTIAALTRAAMPTAFLICLLMLHIRIFMIFLLIGDNAELSAHGVYVSGNKEKSL